MLGIESEGKADAIHAVVCEADSVLRRDWNGFMNPTATGRSIVLLRDCDFS
jgi:hypothetical protein